MDSNIIDMEKQFELKILEDEIERLENENTKLRILLKEAGMDDDVGSVSDEEAICISQINRLKKYSDTRDLSNDEIKNLDLLNKNLRMIRGNLKRGKKSKLKEMTNQELKNQLK